VVCQEEVAELGMRAGAKAPQADGNRTPGGALLGPQRGPAPDLCRLAGLPEEDSALVTPIAPRGRLLLASTFLGVGRVQ
jgi:hypothetical protein